MAAQRSWHINRRDSHPRLRVVHLLAGGTTASATTGVPLQDRNNYISYGGPTLPVAEALNDAVDNVSAVWHFESADQAWRQWSKSLPDPLQGFSELVNCETYWIVTEAGTDWTFASGPGPIGLTAASADLVVGFNSVAYNGFPLPVEQALLDRYRAVAAANNMSMAALMHQCACDNAVAKDAKDAKDAKALAGVTGPQRTTTVTEHVQVGSDPYGNPIFGSVTFPCP